MIFMVNFKSICKTFFTNSKKYAGIFQPFLTRAIEFGKNSVQKQWETLIGRNKRYLCLNSSVIQYFSLSKVSFFNWNRGNVQAVNKQTIMNIHVGKNRSVSSFYKNYTNRLSKFDNWAGVFSIDKYWFFYLSTSPLYLQVNFTCWTSVWGIYWLTDSSVLTTAQCSQ